MNKHNKETTRIPIQFKENVLLRFRSAENINYLQNYLNKKLGRPIHNLIGSVWDFSDGMGQGYDYMNDDNLLKRNTKLTHWSEVRRLNLLFIQNKLESEKLNIKSKTSDEPYHIQMFVSDSFRPKGLENLNNLGPLYELEEDQTPMLYYNPKSNKATKPVLSHSNNPFKSSISLEELMGKKETFKTDTPQKISIRKPDIDYNDDEAWDEGNKHRTAKQAMAEYMEEDDLYIRTEGPESKGNYTTNYELDKKDKTATRFMRYEKIPYWQFGGRKGYDFEINETLGFGSRELDSNIRKIDMDRIYTKGKGYNP